MRAWGIRNFENDSDLDWTYKLIESNDYSFIYSVRQK